MKPTQHKPQQNNIDNTRAFPASQIHRQQNTTRTYKHSQHIKYFKKSFIELHLAVLTIQSISMKRGMGVPRLVTNITVRVRVRKFYL